MYSFELNDNLTGNMTTTSEAIVPPMLPVPDDVMVLSDPKYTIPELAEAA
jgi:hypothetical protein